MNPQNQTPELSKQTLELAERLFTCSTPDLLRKELNNCFAGFIQTPEFDCLQKMDKANYSHDLFLIGELLNSLAKDLNSAPVLNLTKEAA